MVARAEAAPARITRRELGGLVVAALVLAIVSHFGVVRNITTEVAQEVRDPLLQTWQIAWDGHAFATRDLTSFFDGNIFYPMKHSLAFSDALIGYGPTALLDGGPTAALVRYNVWFLLSYVLAFVGAYLLARELGLGPFAATVAALAFAFAPWRLAQDRHLHVISSGGIPLSLFLLARGYRWRRPNAVLGGWLVVAWQISLGFTLGIQLGYLLGVVAVVAAFVWWRRGRPAIDRNVVTASAVGMIVAVMWVAYQATPYLQVVADRPELPRTAEDLDFFSPLPASFIAAPEESLLWGSATAEVREKLNFAQEQVLFPGAIITALGIFGLIGSTFPRRLRLALLLLVAVTAVLSLGTALEEGRFGYRFLYDHLPGWDGSRTPGRLTTLTTLGLGLLGGAGMQWLFPVDEHARGRRFSLWMSSILVVVVMAEGAGRVETHPAPEPPAGLASIAGPRLHLPTDDYHDAIYMYWSTEDFTPIVNGVSGFVPHELEDLRADLPRFPAPDVIRRLREIGVRNVVVHTDLAAGTAWDDLGTRPFAVRGLSRRVDGNVVVFEIEP